MFKDSIGIFQGLIKFIEGLIARKNNFWSQALIGRNSSWGVELQF